MSPTFLVAWREYKQYVFSRGFILLLVMLPLLLIGGAFILSFLESAKPQRAYVVYDATDQNYTKLIEGELDRQYLRQQLAAWELYLFTSVDRSIAEPEDIPYPFGAGEITNARRKAFSKEGGVEAARRAVQGYLRPGAPVFVPPKRQFLRADLPADVAAAASTEDAIRLLKPYLLGERTLVANSEVDNAGSVAGKQLFAAVIVPEAFAPEASIPVGSQLDEAGDSSDTAAKGNAVIEAEYWSANVTDPTLNLAVTQALRSVLRKVEAERLGLSYTDLERISDIDAPVRVFSPKDDLGDAEVDTSDRLQQVVLPGVLTYVLIVVIFTVGNPLLTNTIEERSNKIVEVLLSSVTANQLMVGKLIGIAAVGLTMPAIGLLGTIVASTSLASSSGGLSSDAMGEGLNVLLSSNLLPVFLFYFVAAYLIYAMLFLVIGALSNSIQDAQTYMGPLMLLVFAPTPFVVMVFQNPNGLVASILTWIPIYTPFAVMLRAASDPPMLEIIGATCLMLVFAFFLMRTMGRIFKNAILNASPPKAREIWRLAKADA